MLEVRKCWNTCSPNYGVELCLSAFLYVWIRDHCEHPPSHGRGRRIRTSCADTHSERRTRISARMCTYYVIAATQALSRSDNPYRSASLMQVPTRLGRSIPFDCQ